MNEYEWNSSFIEEGKEVSYSSLLKCSPKGKHFSIFNLALNRQLGEAKSKRGRMQ